MKTVMPILFILLLFFSCKKNSFPEISATVVTKTGVGANSYLVEIDNPDSHRMPFICDENNVPLPPVADFNCRNSAYITNLPSSLQAAGTKIVFSRYKNLGANPVFSSTYVARDVEVYDARKK